jgi:Replication-relaxation
MSHAGGRRPERVRKPYVEYLAERLSARDWSIISTIHRLRLVSGLQLERLHFHELTGRSRSVKRWQTLKRLVTAGVLTTLDRRVGTTLRGSDGLIYALDSAGQSLAQLRANREAVGTSFRRPRVPGDRFIEHTQAVSELYVDLIEHSRLGGFTVAEFQVEPRWPNGIGGWIGPDAFVRLEQHAVADYWCYEADMATESPQPVRGIPAGRTVWEKLLAYLDFVQRGQLGPDGIVPRVMIGVPTSKRREAIQSVVDGLQTPANRLFIVALMQEVAQLMMETLSNE